jgi:hypothetical protein
MPENQSDDQVLLLILDRMQSTVTRGDQRAVSAIAYLRWELGRRLFPYLILDGTMNPRRRRASSTLNSEVRDHFNRWGTSRMVQDWVAYRSETLRVTDNIRSYLAL